VTTTVRNVVIVLALAAAVAFVPGGGTTGAVVGQILSILFLVAIGFAAYKVYREQRVAIYSLGDRNRALLYGAIGLAVLAIAGTNKLWRTGPGTAVWFAMVAAASFAVFTVYRASREY
jgi:multisubunit Na+/H+ antiporter MnhB subunit